MGSEMEVERQQEQLLMKKYGGLVPKYTQHLLARKQARKCFDSADYAMMQHKGTPYPERSLADLFAHGEGSTEMLPVKLEPTPMPPRRLSNLGDS